MMAFSIQNAYHSFNLISKVDDCVLAVPGESLAEEALFCGTQSGRKIDKLRACGLELCESQYVKTPSLCKAIANIEIKIVSRQYFGDHVTCFGEVLNYRVNTANRERNLLSIGPNEAGYKLLARKGIHRIGVHT